ncbi:hypothetical protein [Paractinoplanes maris]|uniref:hypothetical protein n=1 Tax=Paractinoplanes maris TaxID=1734446 RepID=UPI002020F2EF|nr:hypothetical protein [Actinoplanes maris]
MRKLRAALVATAVAGSAAVVVAIGTGSASAAEVLADGKFLPISYPSDLLVDPVNKHVLISDDQTGQLVVTDYHGELVSVRSGLPGIQGLALSPDSRTLYAAVAGAHAIVAFDAATVTEQTHYSVDATMFPKTVATVGGQVWFGYDAGAAGDFAGNFGVLEPATRVLRVHDNTADRSTFHDSPELLASARRLIVADTSNDPATSGRTYTYALGADGAEQYQTSAKFSDSFLRGATLTADGAGLIGWGTACAPWKAAASTPYLHSAAYEGLCHPNDVTVHPDGRTAIGYNNFDTGTDVAIYPGGSEAADETFTLPSTHVSKTPDVADRLAWQPDGPRLFAISHNPANHFRIWVINGPDPVTPSPTTSSPAPRPSTTPPARTTPSLTLTGNGTVNAYGSTVTVTAKLGAPHRTIEIWADPYGGDQGRRLLRRMPANAQGVLTASIKLTRTTSVFAKFVGDTTYAPKEVKSTLHTRVATSFVMSRQYKTGKIGAVPFTFFRDKVSPYFTVTMTPYPGRVQELTIEMSAGGGKWRTFRSAVLKLNKDGKSYFAWNHPPMTGREFRVRTAYLTGAPNDSVNYPTYSAYQYFTFTS